MRMVIEIFGEPIEVDSNHLLNMVFIKETKVGDTFFIETDGGYLSCHENFWVPFKREFKINSIIRTTPNP